MRRTRIEQWCDLCWADGEQMVPATHSFAVGVAETLTKFPAIKLVETCDVHGKPLLDLLPMLSAVVQFKPDDLRTPDAAPLSPHSSAKTVCPVCQVPTTRPALVAHIWSQHVPTPRPVQPKFCPNCSDRSYNSPQGLAVHRRYAHGYDAVAEAVSHVPTRRP